MVAKIPILTLNNGVQMPALGYGTYAKEHDDPSDEETGRKIYESVLWALETGYRHLDCAWYYQNESHVGAALKTFLSSNPSISRSEIFITTKVWPHLMDPEDIEWSLNSSLDNLGVDYVDALLIHWPFAAERTEERKVKLGEDGKYIINHSLTANLEPCWRALEKLYSQEKTRSIGVSNFTITNLTHLLSYATIAPTVNQVELQPFLPQPALLAFCAAHSIIPVAYSPLGSQLQAPGLPSGIETPLQNTELREMAERKGVDVGQVLIAWALRRGTGVLPMSSNRQRIAMNFEVIELSAEEWDCVEGISGRAVEGSRLGTGNGTRFVDLEGIFGIDIFGEER